MSLPFVSLFVFLLLKLFLFVFPFFGTTEIRARDRVGLPASLLLVSLIPLSPKATKEETLASKRLSNSISEIGLIIFSRSIDSRITFAILVETVLHRTSPMLITCLSSSKKLMPNTISTRFLGGMRPLWRTRTSFEPEQNVTAEGLDLMSPNRWSWPPQASSLVKVARAKNLISILDLSVSPISLSPLSFLLRPINNIVAPSNPANPLRFVSNFLQLPTLLMLCSFDMNGRGLCSCRVPTATQWTCDYQLNTLTQFPRERSCMKDFKSAMLAASRVWLIYCSRLEKLDCLTPVSAFINIKKYQPPTTFTCQVRLQPYESKNTLILVRRCDSGYRVSIPMSNNDIYLLSSIPLVPFNSDLAGQGLHASRVSVSLGWFDRFLCRGQMKSFYRIPSETHSPNHYQWPKSWKKNGIMIPSPRNGGYRSFSNFLSTLPLFTKLFQVQFNSFRGNIQAFKSLKKDGIMTPSPRSGGYRTFFNLLYLAASSVEHFTKSSYALIARAVYDHPLVEDFAEHVSMVESAMASKDFSNIASFSKLSIPLENSWSLYLYYHCIISISVCMNLPLLRF